MLHILFRLCLALALLLTAYPAAAAGRVALVFGNGRYEHAPDLPNARNDGAAVAKALRELGFEVLEGIDADMAKTAQLVKRFARRAESADVALFYYAGHGMQVNGENYLVPVDAKLEKPSDLEWETLPASRILSVLEEGDRTNIIILDACRNNPFKKRLQRGTSRSIRVGDGLATMRGGLGTLIAFATAPDDVALDGDGSNSPFTSAFLRHVKERGLEIRQLMTRIRQDVVRETDGQQVPWDHSSLLGDFYFLPPEPASQPGTRKERAPEVASLGSSTSGVGRTAETSEGRHSDAAAAGGSQQSASLPKAPTLVVPPRPVTRKREPEEAENAVATVAASDQPTPAPHTIVQCRGPHDPSWVAYRLITYAQCEALGGSWSLP